MTKTFIPTANQIERKCFLVDAQGQILGRLASKIAVILMGKDEPFFTPHLECGDQVIVINAEGVRVTGRKAKEKKYQRFSGYPGGLREVSFEKMQELHPERIISEAVRRMMPTNKLRDKAMKRLRVFKGNKHPHAAQKPIPLELK
jgi:large subunit ribosomal protein L13